MRVQLRAGWDRIVGIASLSGAPHTIALGAAVGAFVACFPVPGQMILGGAAAALLRVSAPAAMAAAWITNPLTAVPFYAAAYYLGTRIYPDAGPVTTLAFGCTIVGLLTALVTYAVVLRVIEKRRTAFGISEAA